MDEAESLCDNIAIMINGRFVVYGSPGHLKDSYGKGYTINLRYIDGKEAIVSYISQYLSFLTLNGERITDEKDNGNLMKELTYQVQENVNINSVGGLS